MALVLHAPTLDAFVKHGTEKRDGQAAVKQSILTKDEEDTSVRARQCDSNSTVRPTVRMTCGRNVANACMLRDKRCAGSNQFHFNRKMERPCYSFFHSLFYGKGT